MKYLYIIFFIKLFTTVCFGQQGVFNSSNSLTITLEGPSKNYVFITDQLRSAYDKGNKQFEFIILTASIKAMENEMDLNVYQEIFNPALNKEITILARFGDETTGLEQFRQSKDVQLDGELFLFGQSYNIPVQMTITYQNKIIYYTFIGRYNLDPKYVPDNVLYKNRIGGEVKFHGLDGRISGKITGF